MPSMKRKEANCLTEYEEAILNLFTQRTPTLSGWSVYKTLQRKGIGISTSSTYRILLDFTQRGLLETQPSTLPKQTNLYSITQAGEQARLDGLLPIRGEGND